MKTDVGPRIINSCLQLEIRQQQLAFDILSSISNLDETPMDWVKPKHRAKQLQRQEVTENEISAGAWLKQLCEDNVALLQASLPIDNTKKAKRTDDSASIESYVRSIAWGTGVWETESDTGLAMLQDLVHSFGGAASRASRKASTPSLAPNQIAHAKKIGTWITQQLPRAGYDPYVALTCAGWIHALPHVGREISPALWLEVLQSIMTQVNRGWEAGPEEGLFPWILWACEIPLGLAKQLSHLGGKDRIVSDALNRIAQLLEEAAEEPAPLMRLGAQDLRATLASIVRSRWAADSVGARKWYPPQRKAITKLATYALGLTDTDGRQLLFDEADTNLDSEFWLALYELSDRNTKLANTMACASRTRLGNPFSSNQHGCAKTNHWMRRCPSSAIIGRRARSRPCGVPGEIQVVGLQSISRAT